MTDFDPFDEPESVYEAAIFIGSLILTGVIVAVAILWAVLM